MFPCMIEKQGKCNNKQSKEKRKGNGSVQFSTICFIAAIR